MNKLLISTVALVALATTVSAEIRPFIGANITQHNASLEGNSKTKLSPSIKIGIMDDAWRAYGTYDSVFKGSLPGVADYIDYGTYTVHMDMIREINEKTDIYFGLHAGWGKASYTLDEDETYLEYNGWFGGLQYGGQVGVLYNITNDFTVEAGAKYSVGTLTDLYEVVSVSTFSVLTGINYRF